MVEHFQAHISLAQGASSSSGCGATASGTGNGQQLMFALSCTQAPARSFAYYSRTKRLVHAALRVRMRTRRCVGACFARVCIYIYIRHNARDRAHDWRAIRSANHMALKPSSRDRVCVCVRAAAPTLRQLAHVPIVVSRKCTAARLFCASHAPFAVPLEKGTSCQSPVAADTLTRTQINSFLRAEPAHQLI